MTLAEFKKSKFSTYSNWCENINNGITFENLRVRELQVIAKVNKYLETIFSMGVERNMKYIDRFFHEKKFLIFEEPVRMVLAAWPIEYQ